MNVFSTQGHWIEVSLFVLFILLPIASALVCLYFCFKFLKISWRLKNIPISKIRSAAQGYVELYGNADWLFPMTAALTGTPCVWYHCVIDLLKTIQTDEGQQKFWEPIEDQKSTAPFILRDNSGYCILLSEEADIIASHTQVWTGTKRDPTKENVKSFLSTISDFFTEKLYYRYREYRIEKNDPLYVTGNFLTIESDNPLLKDQSHLQHYLKTTQKSTLNVITAKDLPEKNAFLISSILENKIIRKYQIIAWMFFLAFLFFCMVTVSSIYPIAKNALRFT